MTDRGYITIGMKVMIHLSVYSLYEPQYVMSYKSTQEGIGDSVGISRAHTSLELKKLLEAGLVDVCMSHSSVSGNRRKSYYLTGKGTMEVKELIDELRKKKIDERSLIDKDVQNSVPKYVIEARDIIRLAEEQISEKKNLNAAANLLEAAKLLIRGGKQ